MLAYTHTDEVERTCPNITPFQKHIESVMCNDLGEFFNSMFQILGVLLAQVIFVHSYCQSISVLLQTIKTAMS